MRRRRRLNDIDGRGNGRGFAVGHIRSTSTLGLTGRRGAALSLVLSAAYFGLSHWYQGPSGVIEAGVAGLIEGGAYLATGNLLLPIVLHEAFDTAGIALLAAGSTGW